MRYILIIAILLFGVTGFAQNKTANIAKGNTYADLSFTAADTINESETYYIEITNFQDYPAMQDIQFTGSAVTGSGDVVVTAYGKKFSASSYSSIGTVTWDGSADTTYNINVTTANRYRYFKLEFVSDATNKQVLLTDVQFKNWFTGGDLTTTNLALSGSLTVGTTLTVTGQTTFNSHINLGAGDDLLGSTTSDINIGSDNFIVAGATGNVTIAGTLTQTGAAGFAASATLGAGADLLLSTTSDITVSGNTFTVAGATGNTVIAGTLGVTGVTTATGGVALATASTHIWTAGGSVTAVTGGADIACSDGDRYWTEIMIPYNVTLTGASYLVGSVGGTDSVVMQLFNSAGVEVATSKTTGATHGAIVGTTAEFQNCDFTTPYAAVAGVYYVGVQFNGTTAKFRAYTIPASKFVAASASGTWDTKADITAGTTFTADKGPIVLTY